MEPFEIMVSESQERMLAVVEPTRVDAVLAICDKWQTASAAIGEVTGDGAFRILKAGETVGEARVYGGEVSRVPLTGRGPLTLLIPRGSRDRIKARIVYDGPVEAPIEQGRQIGHLKVWRNDQLTQKTPLYAAISVGTGGLHGRAWDGLTELITGWW